MLSGVRVIDATRLLPGPYAGWLLAEMGAEVLKVEEPARGDYIRYNYPRRGGISNVFHLYNRGKRSVALNLKHDEGRAAFLDLVAGADVVLDGNRPGVMDRLRCGWNDCRRRNPRLVYCAVTGFGQSGPYRDRVGHDINYLSLAGVLSALAAPDGRPIAPRLTIADMAGGGLMSVVGILGALLSSRRTGVGRFVDVSMTDTVFSMQGLRLAEELIPGEPRPEGSVDVEGDDWELGVYETADGRFISLDPYENRFKHTLWSIIEAEGCGSTPDRSLGRQHVRDVLAAAIRRRTRARWVELLSEAEVCFAPVYSVDEIPADPHVIAGHLLGDAMDPVNPSPGLRSPLRFDPPARAGVLGPAPRLGQDTEPVLREMGWEPDRIRRAAAAGALGIETPAG